MTAIGTAAPTRTARTARERVREEMTAEILAVAEEHVARDGAAALSLRSIARDLGLAPSALYRYFDGRDALLSALILSAYEALAEVAERAADDAAAPAAAQATADADRSSADASSADAERWQAVPRAIRRWALDNPHQWGLIFGTPVPGYDAPEATVEPYARVAAALVRPLVEAHAEGRLQAAAPRHVDDDLERAVAPVVDGLLPDMPAATVVRALQAWITMVGAINLEVFGHWRNTVLEPEVLYEAAMHDAAVSAGLR